MFGISIDDECRGTTTRTKKSLPVVDLLRIQIFINKNTNSKFTTTYSKKKKGKLFCTIISFKCKKKRRLFDTYHTTAVGTPNRLKCLISPFRVQYKNVV